ncbi:MAG TPA: nicotinate-nucleotide--dimethylbenzimidazole phosphoribosyltransferase [Candidatus Omnitrophota bacterium]|nr:nicotinate-nucleotide--dimethylbenzimidazole phosphoribosyltransferase [Candidatus Omnitrophota bacterium]
MEKWIKRAAAIAPLDEERKTRARARIDDQTRPQGSLGRLERFMECLVAIREAEKPDVAKKRILIFAGDHGVADEGVSAFPKEVTKAMVMNFLNGGATINALGREIGAEVRVIDAGVDADFGGDPRMVHAKVARGTKNFLKAPAMTEDELDRALEAGWKQAEEAKRDGVGLIGLGEMGIANTTSASALVAALLPAPAGKVTGRGTGLNDDALRNKVRVITEALRKHEVRPDQPLRALQCLGGFEIAGMVGVLLGAAALKIPVVVDGWIVSSAALCAIRLNPDIRERMFFSHRSQESGHVHLLEHLKVEPILNLDMRLGEGTAAALAMGILSAAVRVYNEVATFSEAGVSNRSEKAEG